MTCTLIMIVLWDSLFLICLSIDWRMTFVFFCRIGCMWRWNDQFENVIRIAKWVLWQNGDAKCYLEVGRNRFWREKKRLKRRKRRNIKLLMKQNEKNLTENLNKILIRFTDIDNIRRCWPYSGFMFHKYTTEYVK